MGPAVDHRHQVDRHVGERSQAVVFGGGGAFANGDLLRNGDAVSVAGGFGAWGGDASFDYNLGAGTVDQQAERFKKEVARRHSKGFKLPWQK